MGEHTPLILIELVLVLGGVLAFGWWQLRDVKREQARRAAEKAAQAARADVSSPADPGSNPGDRSG